MKYKWGGDSNSVTDSEWATNYDCPFAANMVTIDWNGVIIVIMIGFFLFLLTLTLSFFAYKKWRLLEIQDINEPVIRSWKDNLV